MTGSDKPELARFFSLVFVFISVFPAAIEALDEDPILAGEFWVELDPYVKTEQSYPLEREEAYRRVLEEAQFVFSGMIYGFTFVYTPLDVSRDVDEVFEFNPTAQIPWGDPALTIAQTRTEENLLIALVRYVPSGHQLRWLRMMESNVYQNAAGSGSASLFGGPVGKYTAIAEAAKEAIREFLRPRVLNKPKEVRGKVSLSEVPYVIIDAGEYVAKVTVTIDIDEIIPYRLY